MKPSCASGWTARDICDLSVSVEARVCPCERIEWRVRVLNANPAYSVLSATYPGTSFAGGDAVLFEPSLAVR